MSSACGPCLVESWLFGRGRREDLKRELERFDVDGYRRDAIAAGLEVVCRCDPSYPSRLAELPDPPAVLHVAGGLERALALLAGEPVAIVGSRRGSVYGCGVANSLAAALGRAEVTVVSGMALGIDGAAHRGALEVGAPTIAVVASGADRPSPAGSRSLYARILGTGAVVSELPPGARPRRWAFPARNRIIAALSAMTVVVEGAERSGALITSAVARELGRAVGAVPGRVTSPLAAGSHALLRDGAVLVRGAQDVLDEVFGPGVRRMNPTDGTHNRRSLTPEMRVLLAAIGDGHDTTQALGWSGLAPGDGLAALAALELAGLVRREAGGRYWVVP